jgi:DNA-binding GntR family transcriptional regulator
VTTEVRPLVRPKNLKHAVANHIREQILSGTLHPGTKIDQDALAEALGVSKLPVREALISLEAEALVVNIPRRGSYVADLTADDVRDHYHIYGLVSAVAAERAAERLTDEQLAEMAAMLAEMEVSRDPARLETLNHQFHRMINRAGGSQRLHSVLRLLADSIPARFYEFTTGWSAVAHEDHTQILDALRARDAAAAREAMIKHLREGGERAVGLLEQAGFWRGQDGEGAQDADR